MVRGKVADIWGAISSGVFSQSAACAATLTESAGFAFNGASTIWIKRAARSQFAGSAHAILVSRACSIRFL